MKNPFKKFLKAGRGDTNRLLTNKQSWLIRPLYLAYDLFFKRHGNTYYSGFGEDAVLKNIFHRKKVGFYVDIGCWHPKWGSNTYLLHRRGWKGINIDMDDFKIEMFNIARKNAVNVCTAVSDEEKDLTYYCSKSHSSMNTLNPEFAKAAKENKQGMNYEIKKIKSKTLDNIISATKYANTEIDLLSIDIEGHELPALQSLNFEIYKPKVLIVELHEEKIEAILDNEIYQFIKSKDYSLFSWTLPSLIFVKNGYPIKSAAIHFSNESSLMTPST